MSYVHDIFLSPAFSAEDPTPLPQPPLDLPSNSSSSKEPERQDSGKRQIAERVAVEGKNTTYYRYDPLFSRSSVPQYLRSSPAREQNRSPSPARASGYRQRHSPDLDRNRGGYHSHDAGRSAGMRGTLASQQGRSSPQRGRGGRVGGARGQQPTSPLASRYAVGTVRSPQHASRAVALRSPTARRGGIGSRSWRRSPSPPARGGRSNRRGSGSRGGRIGKRRGRGGRKG